MMRMILCLLFAFAANVAAEQMAPLDVVWNARVPLRDGVDLAANVYKPRLPAGARVPVILHLSPYARDSFHRNGTYFAERGYAFAAVDVRGRGDSGGDFDPIFQESGDGAQVIEWLARQPWSSGQVATMGGSYDGWNQWAMARMVPPALTTIVPAAAPWIGYDWPRSNNMHIDYFWLAITAGRPRNAQIGGDQHWWARQLRETYLSGRPYRELYDLIGLPSTKFREWVGHPELSEYWDKANPTNDEFARMRMPVLSITGYYDSVQRGALEHYRRHTKATQSDSNHYLILGPWGHGGTRSPTRELGNVTFGDASVLDLRALHVQWYDWVMKGGERPAFLKDKVAYFLAGANEWKYAPSVDRIEAQPRRMFLSSVAGRAGDVFGGGSLEIAPPRRAQPDVFKYDPAKIPEADSALPWFWTADLRDQSQAMEIDGRGVIYHTAPFREVTEVTGQVRVEVWMSIDTPDTDFVASLYEILPDGSSVFLASDNVRARYRNSLAKAELVEPGRVERYVFDRFNFFSRQFRSGSRLRLVLSSNDSLFIERNFNSGGVIAEETIRDARTVTVRVHHDARYPSSLTLPIVTGAPSPER